MVLRIVTLGSGSHGNATLVQLGSTRLLVDAGLSAGELSRRLHAVGVRPGDVDYLLLSHEHHDHARGAERFSRVHRVPVVCGRATLEGMNVSPVHLGGWTPLPVGRELALGRVRVLAFPVPHDAAEPVGFVLESEGVRFGTVTDIGHATTLVIEHLRGCDALLVEANHEDQMLQDGPYPWQLKQRVGGPLGHLSNDEAAALLERVVDARCQLVVLAHLSEQNNSPPKALQAAARALRRAGRSEVRLRVAAPDRPVEAVVSAGPLALSRGGRQLGLFGPAGSDGGRGST